MIETPKNIIEAAESLDIDATLALLKATPDAWQEGIDGKTLISVIISHLRNTPKSKKVHEFIAAVLDCIDVNDLDAFILCAEMATTLLHEAVAGNNIGLIRLIIEHDVDRFILRPGDGFSAFRLAMENDALMALMVLVQGMNGSPLEDDRVLAALTETLQINKPACFWSIILGWCDILDPEIAKDLAEGNPTLLRIAAASHRSCLGVYCITIEAALKFNFAILAKDLIEGAIKIIDASGQSEILSLVIEYQQIELALWLLDVGVVPEIDEGNAGLLYSPTLEAAAEADNLALIERLITYQQVTPEVILNTVARCTPSLCGSELGQSIFCYLLPRGEPTDIETVMIAQLVIEGDCNPLLIHLIEVHHLDFTFDFKHRSPLNDCKKSLLGISLRAYDDGSTEGRFDCPLTLIASGYLSYQTSPVMLASLLNCMAIVDQRVDMPLIEFLGGFGASPILLIEDYIKLLSNEEAAEEQLAAYRTAVIAACDSSVLYLESALTLSPATLLHEALAMVAPWYDLTILISKCYESSGEFPDLQKALQALLNILEQVKKAAQDISRVPSLFEQAYISILNAGDDRPELIARLEQLTEQISLSPEMSQRIVDIRNGHVYTLPRLIARRMRGG